jgi:small multidrug resistance pump
MSFHLSNYFHPWVSMILAIIFELVGTINAKASEGLSVVWPTWTMFTSYIISVTFLSFALDKTAAVEHGGIDLGIAYATWSGLGTIAAAVAGVYMYGETLIPAQLFGIFITIVGLIIINVAPSYAGVGGAATRSQEDDFVLASEGMDSYGTVGMIT